MAGLCLGFLRIGVVGEHDHEFVAAHARHQVVGAHAAAQALGDLAQQQVAGLVAQRVVDGLEVVQVDDEYGQGAPLDRGQRQRLAQHLDQAHAVGQLGELVVLGQEVHALLRQLAQRDVAHQHDAVGPALGRHGLGLDLHGDAVAVLVLDGAVEAVLAAAAHVLQCVEAELGADVVEDGAAGQLVQRVAGQAGQGLVAVDDQAVAVHDDGLGRDLGELAHALFAVAHLLRHMVVVAHVGDLHHGALQLPVLEVRHQQRFDMARRSIRLGHLALVAHMFAAQAALHVLGDELPHGFAHDLAHGLADRLGGRQSEIACVVDVGEAAAQRARIEVGQHGRSRICYQPQQRIVGPRVLRIDVLWHASPSLGIYSGIAEILIALLCEGERPLTRGSACGCRASGAAVAACLFFAAPHHVRRGFFT